MSSTMKDNIANFPGYHISRDGLLYSRYNSRGKLTQEYHQNKLYTRSNGYQQVVLKIRNLGLLRRVYIHRLVAEVYIPNPENKPCVCHKDNNRVNNRVENLYWGTYKENTDQAIEDGRLNKNVKLRAIVFSDLHIHDHKKFSSRLDTAFKVLDIISEKCEAYNIPAIHCGDLLHVPEKMSQYLFSRVVTEFKELNSRSWDLYTISGNHTISQINKIGQPVSSWENILATQFKFLHTLDYKRVHLKNFYIYGIPYIDHNIGLDSYIKGLNLVGGSRSKHILLLHTDYPGARDTDGSEVGTSENLNVNLLNKFDLVLIGHIHLAQRLSKKVYMVGAPYQQRRTDKEAKMGYWELYSDLSMKFIDLSDKFPKFIDVESDEEVKEDGNYYTVISKKVETSVKQVNKISKKLSKKKVIRRYLKEKGITDTKKESILLDIIKESEND